MRHISLCGWPLRHHAGVVDHVYGNFSWWHEFSEEHIGVASHNEQAPIWGWLFSSKWRLYDDTPLGAAARIEQFLECGLPANFTDIFDPRDRKPKGTCNEADIAKMIIRVR